MKRSHNFNTRVVSVASEKVEAVSEKVEEENGENDKSEVEDKSVVGAVAEKSVVSSGDSIEEIVATPEQNSMLLMKTFKCPLCNEEFKTHVVRTTKLTIEGRSDFFMTTFKGIDPLWYEIILCPSCGYTEKVSEFEKLIKYNGGDLIRKAMTHFQTKYPIAYSEFRKSSEVIDAYKRYENCLEVKKVDGKVKGRAALTFYEFLLRLGDEDLASEYREKAFGHYHGMFASGILDVDDAQLQQLYIIIGKLYEHKGEYEEAKTNYRNAKMIRGVEDTKFMEIAEDYLMDLEDLMTQ